MPILWWGVALLVLIAIIGLQNAHAKSGYFATAAMGLAFILICLLGLEAQLKSGGLPSLTAPATRLYALIIAGYLLLAVAASVWRARESDEYRAGALAALATLALLVAAALGGIGGWLRLQTQQVERYKSARSPVGSTVEESAAVRFRIAVPSGFTQPAIFAAVRARNYAYGERGACLDPDYVGRIYSVHRGRQTTGTPWRDEAVAATREIVQRTLDDGFVTYYGQGPTDTWMGPEGAGPEEGWHEPLIVTEHDGVVVMYRVYVPTPILGTPPEIDVYVYERSPGAALSDIRAHFPLESASSADSISVLEPGQGKSEDMTSLGLQYLYTQFAEKNRESN